MYCYLKFPIRNCVVCLLSHRVVPQEQKTLQQSLPAKCIVTGKKDDEKGHH